MHKKLGFQTPQTLFKGQENSKANCQAVNSSKKQTNEFNFTIMIPQVDLFLFSFIFWKIMKTPKRHSEINLPLVDLK